MTQSTNNHEKGAMKQQIKIDRKADRVVIAAEIAWHYATEPQSARVIAICPTLNITLELDAGTNPVSAIDSSMKTFFGSLMKEGVLESFLKARGWVTPAEKFTVNTVVETPRVSIVPMHIDDLTPAACF